MLKNEYKLHALAILYNLYHRVSQGCQVEQNSKDKFCHKTYQKNQINGNFHKESLVKKQNTNLEYYLILFKIWPNFFNIQRGQNGKMANSLGLLQTV